MMQERLPITNFSSMVFPLIIAFKTYRGEVPMSP
jgi:hypothetical protein